MATTPKSRPAFSLIELVIVVVIIGIIAAIAIPRLGSASQNSQASALLGSLRVLTGAGDVYTAEHNGLSPAAAADGSTDSSTANFIARLTGKTSADGLTSGDGLLFGPYLRAIPVNPLSGLQTIRVDGAAAGVGSDGWRYDSALRIFQADNSAAAAAVQPGATAADLAAVNLSGG